MTPEELVALRGRLGLSQVELAARLGAHPVTISRYERGVKRIPQVVAMAIAALEPKAEESPDA